MRCNGAQKGSTDPGAVNFAARLLRLLECRGLNVMRNSVTFQSITRCPANPPPRYCRRHVMLLPHTGARQSVMRLLRRPSASCCVPGVAYFPLGPRSLPLPPPTPSA